MKYQKWAKELLRGSSPESKTTEIYIERSDCLPLAQNELPKFPGRWSNLEFWQTPVPKHPINRFPKLDQLASNLPKATVFHHFANHELLAIELMALALLKFHDAPELFLDGIAETIQQEQEHLQAYMHRMQELGLEFGDLPVSGFFWNQLMGMKSPKDFCAYMGMTFEQANLDFAKFYRHQFDLIDDTKSFTIIDKVYKDELSHVKSGFNWFMYFNKTPHYKRDGVKLWNAHKTALAFPMTPARAKGTAFDWEGRLKIALPKTYVGHLEQFTSSKGGLSRIYYPNLGVEFEKKPKKSKILKTEQDLGSLLSFLARNHDIIIAKQPSYAFFKLWNSLKAPHCEFVEPKELGLLKNREFQSFIPWGASSAALNFVDNFKIRSAPQKNDHQLDKAYWVQHIPKEFNETKVIKNIEEIDFHLNDQPKQTWRIKPSKGCSGWGHFRLGPHYELNPQLKKMLKTQLSAANPILMEPEHQRFCDLSFVFSDYKDPKILGLINNSKGQYLGHLIGNWRSVLSTEGKKILTQANIKSVWQDVLGLTGSNSFAIDAYLHQENGNLKLRLPVEINARLTMGHIALKLESYLAKGCLGLWVHFKKPTHPHSKWSYEKFCQTIQTNKAGLVHEGVLPTHCFIQAKQTMTLLIVAEEIERIKELAKIYLPEMTISWAGERIL